MLRCTRSRPVDCLPSLEFLLLLFAVGSRTSLRAFDRGGQSAARRGRGWWWRDMCATAAGRPARRRRIRECETAAKKGVWRAHRGRRESRLFSGRRSGGRLVRKHSLRRRGLCARPGRRALVLCWCVTGRAPTARRSEADPRRAACFYGCERRSRSGPGRSRSRPGPEPPGRARSASK
jgi:hypothetical protein